MKTRLINDGPQKTYVLVLDKGDEAVSSIEGFARKNGIAAAQLTGIGAVGAADDNVGMQRRLTVGPKGDVAKEGNNLDLLGDGNLPVVLRLPIEETEHRVAEIQHRFLTEPAGW